MIFIVAGYDNLTATYGRIFEVKIPSVPNPVELLAGSQFGAAWGGQRELTDRLVHGFDPNLPTIVMQHLKVPQGEQQKMSADMQQELRAKLTIPIPWQFLPLQDCVDVSIFSSEQRSRCRNGLSASEALAVPSTWQRSRELVDTSQFSKNEFPARRSKRI